MVAILKILKQHLLPNSKSYKAETWWYALGRQGDSELLKSYGSDIQNGGHGGHLENLQKTSAPNTKTD